MALIRKEIGDLLVDNGVISAEELEFVREERSKTGETVPSILNRLGLANENALKNALELQYGVSYVPLRKYLPDRELVIMLPEDVIRKHQVVPISKQGDRLTLAMVNPSDSAAIEEVKKLLNQIQIKPVVCLEEEFDHFIDQAYQNEGNGGQFFGATTTPLPEVPRTSKTTAERKINLTATGEFQLLEDEQLSEAELTRRAQEEAIVLLANQILGGAIKKGCSNIHIVPTDKQAIVNHRLNGVLVTDRKLPKTILPALVARYKMMARLSLSERSQPQDGHIKVKSSNREIVCLVSTIPTSLGEHVVVWIL